MNDTTKQGLSAAMALAEYAQKEAENHIDRGMLDRINEAYNRGKAEGDKLAPGVLYLTPHAAWVALGEPDQESLERACFTIGYLHNIAHDGVVLDTSGVVIKIRRIT